MPTGNGKRKAIKKKDRKDIEDSILNYFKCEDERHKSFDDVYWSWRKVQDTLVSDNTAAKYDTDYMRYFDNEDFSQMQIVKITEEDAKVFICQKVKTLKLCQKACKTLFGYIKNTFKSAVINKIIAKNDNPMDLLDAKMFYKYCEDKPKQRDDRIISDDDMALLYSRFMEDYHDQPEYIPTYAVHLASLTGMRVGELSALTWDCITDEYIIIDKSEKYNRKKKEYYIDKTKNGKSRLFPITKEIKSLLERVKAQEIKNGFICEWVFADADGRIHAPVISSCAKNKCRQLGIKEKGIHAYRRTINSRMRCKGVSATVAASLLGHSVEVNEQYYTFDTSTLCEKIHIVSEINQDIYNAVHAM